MFVFLIIGYNDGSALHSITSDLPIEETQGGGLVGIVDEVIKHEEIILQGGNKHNDKIKKTKDVFSMDPIFNEIIEPSLAHIKEMSSGKSEGQQIPKEGTEVAESKS